MNVAQKAFLFASFLEPARSCRVSLSLGGKEFFFDVSFEEGADSFQQNLLGTASDPDAGDIISYTVSASPFDNPSASFRVFSGQSSVVDGFLGTLDFTLLQNGICSGPRDCDAVAAAAAGQNFLIFRLKGSDLIFIDSPLFSRLLCELRG